MENLRQICIYHETWESENYNIWFEYVSRFEKMCLSGSKNITDSCSYDTMKKVGVKRKNIDKCIKDSVDGTNLFIDDNFILKSEQEFIREIGLSFFPSLMINN